MVAEHVEQGDGADHGPAQVGALGDGGAHQQSAVGPAPDGQAVAAGAALGDQPVGGGVEVVEHLLLVGQHPGPVPVLAVLAAAPDAGDGVDAARLAEGDQAGGEAGRRGDGEAAVAGEEGRRVGPDLGRPPPARGTWARRCRRWTGRRPARPRTRAGSRGESSRAHGCSPVSGVHRHRPGGRANEVKVRKARSSWPPPVRVGSASRPASEPSSGRPTSPPGVPSRPYRRRRETACSVDDTMQRVAGDHRPLDHRAGRPRPTRGRSSPSARPGDGRGRPRPPVPGGQPRLVTA